MGDAPGTSAFVCREQFPVTFGVCECVCAALTVMEAAAAAAVLKPGDKATLGEGCQVLSQHRI